MSAVRWTDWHGEGLEHCCCQIGANGMVLEGVVSGRDQSIFGAYYRVCTDARFHTREVQVLYVSGPSLHIISGGEGHWHEAAGGEPIHEISGCIDVDIGFTPATNSLPIQRLKLQERAYEIIEVAYVPPMKKIESSLVPRRAEQRYTCLILGQRYRYEGVTSGFAADIEVDGNGLPMDYPGVFRRV